MGLCSWCFFGDGVFAKLSLGQNQCGQQERGEEHQQNRRLESRRAAA
jgi:hypothetical protein